MESLEEWIDRQKRVEQLDLVELVLHRMHVSADARLDAVYDRFKEHEHDFMAVTYGEEVLGLCSRRLLGFLMGSRYGFSVLGKKPIREHMVQQPLRLKRSTPVREALRLALGRLGRAFYDDILLVDENDQLLGIVPVPTLVRVQSALMTEKFNDLEARRFELLERNERLTHSLNELNESQGRNRHLFENQALGVAFLDEEGRIEAVNGVLSSWVDGLTPGSEFCKYLSGECGDAWKKAHRGILLDHRGGSVDCTLGAETSKLKIVRCFLSWVPETHQTCVFLHDVTQQRLLEKSVQMKEKTALTESLVAGVAHELNNKLLPISGFSEMLMAEIPEGQSTERLREYAQTIGETAMEAGKIIRQLQQLSRPEAARSEVFEIQEVVQGTVRVLKFKLQEEGVTVRVKKPSTPLMVHGDAGQIKQVLMNLGLNAIHAMRSSKEKLLEIEVDSTESTVEIRVSDHGHGIPSEILPRVFDPFFTTKAPNEGTGLGLSVCLSIVQHHRGELQVESEPGKGTTFTVSLPAVITESKSIPKRNGNGHHEGDDWLKKRFGRVLIVDDEKEICTFLSQVLVRRFGCSVTVAHHGGEAVQEILHHDFDLVISDVRMPEMTGVQFLEWLERERSMLVPRFCFITGESEFSDLSREIAKHPVPVLRKPFGMHELCDMCEGLFHGRPGPDEKDPILVEA